MTTLGLDAAALTTLRGAFSGDVLLPSDRGYDDARAVYNGSVDKHPGLIAQCADTADVVQALAAARSMGLEVSVRGGGHGVLGNALSEGGVVLDLRRMNKVTVDPDARTARVGGGATMADLDTATTAHGLATTGGRVSTTGVGGFTLGGGSGWLERKYGLACDNMLAVEMVTADGQILTADADHEPELFWALHGGGGNFGVVTAFTMRLFPLPDFSVAMFLYEPDAGPEVARTYRDFIMDAPDECGGGCIFMTGPPEDFVPPELQGQLACGALITYAGPVEAVQDLAGPLMAMAPNGAMVAPVPYQMFQSMLDDPPGMRNYWSAEYLDGLPDEAIDRFCARAGSMPVPSGCQHVVFPQGGAMARNAADYPMPWRASPFAVHPFGLWEDAADDERCIQWVRSVRADMQPWASGNVYLNFIGDEGRDRLIAGFGGPDNYARLGAVKAQYDPQNVFHLNHNIKPA
ncbi:FAD-binding oxidoreductase [Yinghuangia seranimata]|uniref:FAD-binding oxidoreductase n=1 Tax=Yinghuangia seranimata TaxID=408067 RepID=UPI00248AE24C|nr:FAD-binding oxidoreductase [Yinghuangia seranimata]MDI2131815.1 FAD-binding oxidoreductase [Yinghuangia seranimata]